jgi:hypothetical protein
MISYPYKQVIGRSATKPIALAAMNKNGTNLPIYALHTAFSLATEENFCPDTFRH